MSDLQFILGFEPTHGYVSGPMRNRDGFNFPAFFEVEAALLAVSPDMHIFNPGRADVDRTGTHDLLAQDPTGLTVGRFLVEEGADFDLRQAIGEDLAFICEYADILVMLPEWEQSSGATAERATALALGIHVIEWERLSAALGDPGRSADTGQTPSGAPGGGSVAPASDSSPHEDALAAQSAAVGEFLGSIEEKGGKSLVQRLLDAGRAYAERHPEEPDQFIGDRLLAGGFESVGHTEDGATVYAGPVGSEVRMTSATGGQKGVKMAAFDQISPQIEWEVAEHFGAGALKYDAHNFRRGYPWSQSYSALRRHLADFWAGKVWDTCPEDAHGCKFPEGFVPVRPNTCFNHTGSRHIVAVIWHAMALAEFSRFDQFKEYDDRYVYTQDN